MTASTPNLFSQIFQDTPIAWGSKYPRESSLLEIWEHDRDYLIWAANLKSDKPNRHPLPPYQGSLVTLAYELGGATEDERLVRLEELSAWRRLSREGEGLSALPRPNIKDCQNIIAQSTILGAHGDLDGIYSAASAISCGEALGGGKMPGAFHRLRIFRYGFRSLTDYSESLFGDFGNENECCSVVIDFAAHPQATLNLDHHATALSYWEFGEERPIGVFDTKYPSCPSLLADCCGLEIPSEVLIGCDKVDGALYKTVEECADLSNPFVALEFALGVDVSDLVAKKAILTLAEGKLDPHALLKQPIWKARVDLVALEFEEQRAYWSKKSRFQSRNNLLAIADARLSPYSASRFRYLPFENQEVQSLPYLVTIRPKSNRQLNLGISRNPFYPKPSLFTEQFRNLGGLAKALGEGGGRVEASAVSIEEHQLDSTLSKIQFFLEGEDI